MINSEFVSAVLFQVLLFFIFISIFFFTYSAFTEKNTVINQINFLVDETIAPILKFNSKIKESINNINASSESIKKADQETKDNNNKVLSKTIAVLVITSMLLLSVICFLFINSNNKNGFFKSFNINKLIFESIIILIFVGITEYVFLTYFGSRFIAIDVNKIKISLVEKIKQYFNE